MTEATDIEQATSLNSAAALIAQYLRSSNINPEPLFEEVGIHLNEINQPDRRYPTTQMQELWALLIEVTGDPCVGLKVSAYMQPSALHGLGFAWLASDTLRDGLCRLVRFSRFVNTFIEIKVEDHESSVDLVICGVEKWPNVVYAAVDMAMASFLRMCRIMVGGSLNPVKVCLRRPRPPCVDEFNQVFRAPIIFGATDYRLCFDKVIIDKALPTPDPEFARLSDQTVIDYLARFDRDHITMQVRSRIVEQLTDGTPHQNAIATSMNISLRALQRKLRSENTNFKELLEQTRRELAMQYIRENYRPIGEITYLLGFSEPSNFTRAFKRWTGVSPAEFRQIPEH